MSQTFSNLPAPEVVMIPLCATVSFETLTAPLYSTQQFNVVDRRIGERPDNDYTHIT